MIPRVVLVMPPCLRCSSVGFLYLCIPEVSGGIVAQLAQLETDNLTHQISSIPIFEQDK